MIGFFTETLGANLIARKKFGAADGASLDLNGTTINLRVARDDEEILGDASKPIYGYHHVALEVEDVEAAYRELANKGFTFSMTPQAFEKFRIAFFSGPDNITIELIQTSN
jgi:catechol 2,3-dioxygenase-like lactoylglutathione lyase family enzyme